jgi:hypothetical protein
MKAITAFEKVLELLGTLVDADEEKVDVTAGAGSTTTTLVDATITATADTWKYAALRLTSGDQCNELRIVRSSAVGSVTWQDPLNAAPENGDVGKLSLYPLAGTKLFLGPVPRPPGQRHVIILPEEAVEASQAIGDTAGSWKETISYALRCATPVPQGEASEQNVTDAIWDAAVLSEQVREWVRCNRSLGGAIAAKRHLVGRTVFELLELSPGNWFYCYDVTATITMSL